MKSVVLALAASIALVAGHAAADASKTPDVADSSFATDDGARTLQQSVIIDAPATALWKAFADTEEFKRWNAPVAAIDMRVGGMLEATYDPGRALGDPDNIKNRIVTFLPERLIVFQNIQAPRGLPHADLFQKTVTVVQFEPLTPVRTRVTISSTGWATDDMSGKLYAFFQTDNAQLLQKMKAVYEAHGGR